MMNKTESAVVAAVMSWWRYDCRKKHVAEKTIIHAENIRMACAAHARSLANEKGRKK